MFGKTPLPFPLEYETTVFELPVGWGREKTVSSDTEIQPFSPWMLVDLNLGKKKRECRFFKESDKSTFQSIFSRILHVQKLLTFTKIFWVRWCLITSRYTKELVQWWKKSSHFWVILMPSWCISGIQQPMRQHW